MPAPMPVPETMHDEQPSAVTYAAAYLGTSLERLLTPLDGPHPTGESVRGTMMFRMVEQTRRSDDASLPMGAWVVEPRRANWAKVSSLIVGLLGDTTKDLQLAAWLLEAEVHQRGFAALAPCLALMQGLCDRWWPDLHPQPDGTDFEARSNIVSWLNERMPATLALVTLVEGDEYAATWSHWELARYNEKLLAVNGELPEDAREAATIDDLHALLATAPEDELRATLDAQDAAIEAIVAFDATMRDRLGGDAPSLAKLRDTLARMQGPLRGELGRRGRLVPDVDADEALDVAEEPAEHHDSQNVAHGMLMERDRAYDMLAQIANFLVEIEPHSPVPYLLRRAVAWGALNAAELHKEIYQRGGGRIEIADLFDA